MIAFLKLIRWPNILMVWITMSLVLFGLINPVLSLQPFEAGLSLTGFLLLLAIATFVTIAGYLLNDLQDINPDSVNKPGKNLVGRKFGVHMVQGLYWFFTISAILAGVLYAALFGQTYYVFLFVLLSTGLLWFYTKRYQCQPLTGNLVVAFLSALTLVLVWMFNFLALAEQADILVLVQASFYQVNVFMLIFSGFAFLTSLLREMVKDLEDFKGDDRFGCRTFAVVAGVPNAKKWAMLVTVIAVVLTLRSQVYFYHAGFRLLFGFFMLIDALFITALFKLAKAESPRDFKNISLLLKIVMVAGMMSMALVYCEFEVC